MAEDRKAFDRDLDSTPDLSMRIVIGKDGVPSVNMELTQLINLLASESDTYTKAQIDSFFLNYLSKTNLKEYNPTQDYHPATVLFVKNKSKASYVDITSFGSNTSGGFGKVAQADNVVHFSGRFADDNLQDGDTAFTLPETISPPLIDVYIHCGSISGGGSARLKISSGQRVAVVEDQESGTGATMSFNETYLTSI